MLKFVFMFIELECLQLLKGVKVGNLKYIGASLVVALGLGFSGCSGGGGGSSSNTQAVATVTGQFIDAPVQGLNYSTATQSGQTDSSGNFKYRAGETVTFKLGTLTLGTVTATSSLNPLDLAGDNSLGTISTKAQNIAMLLQNLDQNRTDNTKIVIASALKDHNFSTIDLTAGSYEASMNALLAGATVAANIDQVNNTVITLANATAAMTSYLKSYHAGTYSGTVSVSESYYSGFTCTSNSNYSITVASSGNDFIITAPITITSGGIDTTRNVTWTTSSLSAFNSNYSSVASPLGDYSYKIENIAFNGKTLSGKWYMKSSIYGALCDGTYNLSK